MTRLFNKLHSKILFVSLLISLLTPAVIFAADEGLVINPDDGVIPGFREISIPSFFNLDQIAKFSPMSYVAFGFSLIFVGISIYWVYLIVRAGVQILNSQGDTGKIQGAYTQIGSIFWSITFIFVFLAMITLAGAFFGMGGFWSWPKKLSLCEDGSLYVTIALEQPSESEATIDNMCFNDTLGAYRSCMRACSIGDDGLECRRGCAGGFRR